MKASTLEWLAEKRHEPVESREADFDFDEIDRRNGWHEPDEAEPATEKTNEADLLRLLVEALAPPRVCPQGASASGLKVMALAWLMNARGLRRYSQRQLAEMIGTTHAALSVTIKRLERRTRIRFPRQVRKTKRK